MRRSATARLIVAVTLSLAGVLIAVLAGMAEVALFVGPWIVVCVLGLTQSADPRIRANVSVAEDRVLTGDTVHVAVHIESDAAVLVAVTADPSARFVPQGSADDLPRVVVAVEPGQPRNIDLELLAAEWGAHDLGGIRIQATTPYGLLRLHGAAAERQPVRVHPTLRQLDDLLTPWNVRRVAGTHRSSEKAQGIEYADIRTFEPGDSMRDINWRASARRQDLWVSQRHPDRATDVVLLVDSFVESGHDVRSVFGLVLDSAIALADSHLGAADRVGMIEFGGLVRWVSPGTGRVQLQRLTDSLLSTGLYANAADKELPVLSSRTLPPRSFIVAFSPLLDQRFIDAIFAVRARGHDVAVIECAPFGSKPSSDAPHIEHVAHRLWQAERTMLRDQMAEQGIAAAQWDGDEHLDVVLRQLIRRRRRSVRLRGR